MGKLYDIVQDKIKEKGKVNLFKENSTKFFNLYQKPDGELVRGVPMDSLIEGRFYFIIYKDDSNWMKFAPIFFIDHAIYKSIKIFYGVNLNFLPLEIRVNAFDNVYDPNKPDCFRGINFEKAYKLLLKFGFEYGINEFDSRRIQRIYEIDMSNLADFIMSGYPANKYDPKKLYDIWEKKLETKEARHQAFIQATLQTFYDTENAVGEPDVLKDRIKRIQAGTKKYT